MKRRHFLTSLGAVSATGWVGVTNLPQQVGQQWLLMVQPPPGNRFFRLLK